MDSAITRFFTIPELFQKLESLLPSPSFVALAKVDRRHYEIYTPLIYKTILLQPRSSGKNLFDSFDALDNCFRFTREITLDGRCCGSFSRSLKVFEEELQASQASQVNNNSILDTSISQPSSFSSSSAVMTLPQMVNLTHLHSYGAYSFRQPIDLAYKEDYDSGVYLTQSCDVLRFCARLVDLNMRDVPIHNEQDIVLLARALTGLNLLSNLQLCLRFGSRDLLVEAVSPLFFALPSGVEVLELGLQCLRPTDMPQTTSVTIPGVTIDTLTRRQEPLYKLRSWGGMDAARLDLETIAAMFSHCPELERLDLPDYYSATEIHRMAGAIATSCPKLKHLYHSYSGQDPLAIMMISLITAMAQDTLVSLKYNGAEDEEHRLATSIERHLGSLKKIDMQCCYHMESKSIQTILAGCRQLEMLVIEGCYDPHEFWLAEAVAQQWASTRIRHLAIEINIGSFEVLRKGTVYSRPLPIVFEDSEVDRMRQLKRLYQQLGSLVELEYLDLRIAVDVGARDEQDNYLNFRSFSFPCLMALRDEKTGRPGYLHLLAGWKNLKTLRGSFYADTEETKLTIDQDVCAWIHKHWPRVEKAAFFHRNTTLGPPFQWLVDQRADSQVPLTLFG
ncbi:hypothetical protein BGX24_010510 [Mortierella sp. AD032]|nr:hypothetical protein BGX24_010510 [Mortierella sp. AD032]